jgi:photosystem II stability/assembly factor-like uncharacterized protein
VPTISASRPVVSHAIRTIFGHCPAPAVALALLLAALLAAGCGSTSMPGRTSGMRTPATPTPTTVVTPTTPPQSTWHIVPGLENLYDVTLAPSDPRIAYRLTLGSCTNSCPGLYTLSESADDGPHWSPRTLPSLLTQYESGGNNAVFLYVSPVQPQVLILASAAVFAVPATCPSAATARVQQTVSQYAVICWIHFYSADGGQTWRQITLPAPGVLIATPQARGTTLYATVSELLGGYYTYIPKQSVRLVESHDGGQTWQTIDGALVSAGQYAVSLASVPASSILYAVADTMTSVQGHSELWRSNDDGGHWQRLPVLPAQALQWISAGMLAGDRKLVLYLGGEVGPALTPQIFASTDSGNHWSAMPSTGIDIAYPVPGGGASVPGVGGGVLADGSILQSFSANTNVVAQPACAFYAWAPGQSRVQPIGAQLSGSCGSFLLVPAGPAEPGSLWVVYNPFTASATSETAWLPLADA